MNSFSTAVTDMHPRVFSVQDLIVILTKIRQNFTTKKADPAKKSSKDGIAMPRKLK
jgi:hypothetical protein